MRERPSMRAFHLMHFFLLAICTSAPQGAAPATGAGMQTPLVLPGPAWTLPRPRRGWIPRGHGRLLGHLRQAQAGGQHDRGVRRRAGGGRARGGGLLRRQGAPQRPPEASGRPSGGPPERRPALQGGPGPSPPRHPRAPIFSLRGPRGSPEVPTTSPAQFVRPESFFDGPRAR